MGPTGSWVGIRTDDRAAVLAEFGLVETGEFDSGREVCDFVTVLPGWVVVFVQAFDFASPAVMRRISAGREAVGCRASETVMRSAALGHSGGEEVWSVAHDPEKGVDHLEARGGLPDELDAVRARLRTARCGSGWPFGFARSCLPLRRAWASTSCCALQPFVRKGAEPRYGRAGRAYVPPQPLTLMERIMGRTQEPAAAIEQAIENGRRMLDAVDSHLREGASDPNLTPADYLDERPRPDRRGKHGGDK